MSKQRLEIKSEALIKHQELEQAAIDSVIAFAKENNELLKYIAHWGDGRGGYIAELIVSELGMPAQLPSDKAKDTRPKISKAKRKAVFDLFGNQCLKCKSYDEICIDHVIPLAKGGENTVENMQPLCRTCNSAKGVDSADYREVRQKCSTR